MRFGSLVAYTLGVLALVIVTVFVLETLHVTSLGIFGPRLAQVERDITVNSNSFIQSQNSAALNFLHEYQRQQQLAQQAQAAGDAASAKLYMQQAELDATMICDLVQPMAATPKVIAPAILEFLRNTGCVPSPRQQSLGN